MFYYFFSRTSYGGPEVWLLVLVAWRARGDVPGELVDGAEDAGVVEAEVVGVAVAVVAAVVVVAALRLEGICKKNVDLPTTCLLG